LLYAAVESGLTGVSLRVEGPGIDFVGAAGVADLATGEPLTPEHVMYVASLGKLFTATVALQLCSEGRLILDAPITTWLPVEVTSRIPSSGKITLRHLLNHTSGISDYLNDDSAWRLEFARDPSRHWTHADIIPYLFAKPLLFAPGTSYHYSNSNYILVGRILEQVTGQPFHSLTRARILRPLGLRHTFNGNEDIRGKRAHGYVERRGRFIDTYPWYGHYGLADSGIHSTPDDLALFLRSLFTTGQVLNKTMQKELLNGSGNPSSHYGMGIYVKRLPGAGRWYAHDGVDPGYRADMMFFPDKDLAVVLSANASLGQADVIYDELIAAIVRISLDAVREERP
jgi:D-alanyl-D-alanine carboxypeptidase